MKPTHVVYRHPRLVIVQDPITGNRKVVVTTSVKGGVLLLLEHLITDTDDGRVLVNVVAQDTTLGQVLAPRSPGTTSWTKVRTNAFHHDGRLALGQDISSFNHSCMSNARTWVTACEILGANYTATFISVYAYQDIAAGEEVTISYENDIGHDESRHHSFECTCGLDKDQRTKASHDRFTRPVSGLHRRLIDRYMDEGSICESVVTYHLLADLGCYGHTVTPLFLKFLEREFNVEGLDTDLDMVTVLMWKTTASIRKRLAHGIK